MAQVLKTGTTALAYTRNVTPSVLGTGGGDMECDVCHLEDIIRQAKGFCISCKQYMCGDCQHAHQTNDTTKVHIFLIGSEMPVPGTAASPRAKKITVDNCERHEYKMAEYFCPKHEDVFCIDCRDSRHSGCTNVEFVKTVAKGVKGGKELPRTVQNIRKMVTQLERIKRAKESQKERMEEQMTDSIKAVNAMRLQIDAILDRLEKNIKSDIMKKFEKETKEIDDVKKKCIANISILEEEFKQLEIRKKSDDSQCFVALLKASQSYAKCDFEFKGITKEKREIRLDFEPNHKLMVLLKDIEAFGFLKASIVRPQSANGSIYPPTPTPSLDIPSNMMSALKNVKELVLCGEHVITAPDDTKSTCSVTGSTFLPDGRLLLCDGRNNSAKLFDQTFQLKSTLKLTSTPTDVSGLTNREAVITVPGKKEIHFVIMDPELRTTRVLNTDIGCHGIRAHRDGLLVACYNARQFGFVQLLDTEGRVKQRFERDVHGESIFEGPYFMALSPKKDRFYVTDKGNNTVLGLTMGGKVIFRYRSKQLDGPGYICVDKEGSIYVCGRDSRNIHVLKPDGRKLKVLLEGNTPEPSSLCYRASDGTFILSTNNSERTRSYKLL